MVTLLTPTHLHTTTTAHPHTHLKHHAHNLIHAIYEDAALTTFIHAPPTHIYHLAQHVHCAHHTLDWNHTP